MISCRCQKPKTKRTEKIEDQKVEFLDQMPAKHRDYEKKCPELGNICFYGFSSDYDSLDVSRKSVPVSVQLFVVAKIDGIEI